ncbi:MAG: L-seryl-tRNA(Sec) selenium transferase [Thermoanaerobaculia bacterium]|nr:L-seryl-tRNA(Sec) selenium transferase [Thermoanaerobaculia bacterium]
MTATLAASDARRRLPAIDRLLQEPEVAVLAAVYGRDAVTVQARRELAALRARIEAGEALTDARLAELPHAVAAALAARLGRPLRRVLNATGVFLHTNLGRAPLPREIAASLPELASAACDLELDLAGNRRGERLTRIAALLEALTGAEAAIAVNNNAAALVLALTALAAGREVVVSRGELVEIGDSFRIPEMLAAAGARLVEVGTTNRTHLADYERAIGPATAALLKVHTSNYRVRGFVAAAAVGELAALAHARDLPLVVDEGAGLLRPHGAPQLADHPSFAELLGAGVDLVCGSGDKLLGGPQAGLLAGRRELVERCRRHPLYRALRLGRLAATALEGVLRRQLAGRSMPLDRLWADAGASRPRLARVAGAIGAAIVPAEAFVGGGAAPDAAVVGEALALPGDDDLALRLRTGEPAVVGYLRDGRLILDLRTVDPADDDALVAAVIAARG